MNNNNVITSKFIKLFCLFGMLLLCNHILAQKVSPQTTKTTVKKVTPKMVLQALPHSIFFQLIDSTDKFVINHQSEFKHIDVPKKFYNQFTSYIQDSAVAEVQRAKSLVYYNYTLTNGKFINGDIFWTDTKSYIVFNIDGKKYVNYFTRAGVVQLKTLFKL